MALPRTLRHLPLARLLLLGEVVLMAQQHVSRLEPAERRRIVALLREGRGRRRNLSEREREELATLIAKAEPRQFVGTVAQRLSPVPLPRRVVQGRRRRATR